MDAATAVIDASVMYGAARYLRDDYATSPWSYRKGNDRSLFLEFLHDLLLYEQIIMDDSSVTVIGAEIYELVATVNSRVGKQLLELKELTKIDAWDLYSIKNAVGRLVAAYPDNAILSSIQVPWAYQEQSHVDYDAFARLAAEHGFPATLVPFAIFVFRGFCYAGFANGLSSDSPHSVTYLAAPGRLSALERVASSEFITTVRHAREAYADLLSWLPLPSAGYRFETFFPSFMQQEVSALARAVLHKSAVEALDIVLTMRATKEADQIRKEWNSRLWNFDGSAVVGPAMSQSIRDSNITGDVHMHIYGSPAK
jgi:hypothetical protein